MSHTFEAARFKRLMSAERRQELPPRPILEKIGLREGQVFVDISAGPKLSDRVPLKILRELLVETGFAVERVFRPNEMEYAVVALKSAGKEHR